jgi:hypothetical protein
VGTGQIKEGYKRIVFEALSMDLREKTLLCQGPSFDCAMGMGSVRRGGGWLDG